MHTDIDRHELRRAMRRALKGMRRGGGHGAMKGPHRGHFPGPGGPFGLGDPFDGESPFAGGRGGPRGGGGGRRRLLRTGELRLVLLHLVSQQARHGYDLIKAIEELTGGAYAPSPGTVYPTLQLLLDEGTVSELPDESARKVFAITAAGAEVLEAEGEAAKAAIGRLSSLGDERRSGSHRQVQRAMENLRNALHHQRAAGLDQAKVEQIVDLIDEAARKIERL